MKPQRPKVLFLQTCLPDYRLPLFTRLIAVESSARLLCGRSYFTTSLSLCTEPASWRFFIENHFLLGRGLLWQAGAWSEAVKAEVLIAEFNPRIISTWLILLWRKLTGRPTLLWGHLWGKYGPQWLARYIRVLMLGLSDGMITYSRSQADEVSRLMPELSVWAASNSCVTRAMCGPTQTILPGCISYVGRLIEDKKPELLLEAFARVVNRLPSGSKLLIVGDGTEWSRLRQRVKELGLAGRVEMPGHIGDADELRKIYERSIVAVSPGYVGLSAIQAMAFGVPMLVSRKEPHSPEIEACIEGINSVFFDTDDIDDLANKLADFFTPDSPWKIKRAEISQFVADNYTFDGMVETFTAAVDTMGRTEIEGVGKADTALESPVAVVWAQFGPYHLARLAALKDEFGARNIVGVEIGSRTSTYAWQRNVNSASGLITLMPGQASEEITAIDIYRAALRCFRQRGVQVVFVPSYWPASSLATILAARTAGARVVMMNDSHEHTAKAKGIWAELKRWLVLQFDAALVAGEPQRDYFANMGLPQHKLVTGYDAVDNKFFAQRSNAARCQTESLAIRARHGLPDRYFLNVGRMVWKKNLEVLVDAYKKVKDRVGDVCPALVLIGSGKLERSLRERCLGRGLSVYQAAANAPHARHGAADVYFLGFRQVDELPDFYALAECFVLPSREEEWGLVVNEAMACGLPVIVSNVAGCARDLVRHGENGFLFDPFDADTLSEHLETIALDPERSHRMGIVSQRIIAGWGCDRFAQAAREAAEIALGRDSGLDASY